MKKISINHYSMYLIAKILNQPERTKKSTAKKKKGDTDQSLKIKKDFAAGWSTGIANILNITPVTVTKWAKGMSDAEKGSSLYRLWQQQYIEVSLTDKAINNNPSVIKYLEKTPQTEQKKEQAIDDLTKKKKWSKEEILQIINEQLSLK